MRGGTRCFPVPLYLRFVPMCPQKIHIMSPNDPTISLSLCVHFSMFSCVWLGIWSFSQLPRRTGSVPVVFPHPDSSLAVSPPHRVAPSHCIPRLCRCVPKHPYVSGKGFYFIPVPLYPRFVSMYPKKSPSPCPITSERKCHCALTLALLPFARNSNFPQPIHITGHIGIIGAHVDSFWVQAGDTAWRGIAGLCYSGITMGYIGIGDIAGKHREEDTEEGYRGTHWYKLGIQRDWKTSGTTSHLGFAIIILHRPVCFLSNEVSIHKNVAPYQVHGKMQHVSLLKETEWC